MIFSAYADLTNYPSFANWIKNHVILSEHFECIIPIRTSV